MAIHKLKICMIGATGVGKTSLVARFVRSIFHERYATTIGVHIQTRVLERGQDTIRLLLWDLSGEDEFQSIRPAYLRGAAGYLLVADGTRPETLDTALALSARVRRTAGDLPVVLVINKHDLTEAWALEDETIPGLVRAGISPVSTSAKTGEHVPEAFERLVEAILRSRGTP